MQMRTVETQNFASLRHRQVVATREILQIITNLSNPYLFDL